MKFTKPTLPKLELNADESKVLKELTEYLQDLANNTGNIMYLTDVIDVNDADYNTLCNFIEALSKYNY